MNDVVGTVSVVLNMMFAASSRLSRDCFGGLPITGVLLRDQADCKKYTSLKFKTFKIYDFILQIN